MKPKRTRKAAAAAAGAGFQVVAASTTDFTEREREEIARLAYSYWQERGGEHGSHEEDWYRAEEEVRRRRHAASE